MEYVRLGDSPISVSRLGFGCDPMGGHAWGHVDPDAAAEAILAALDNGITLFDTADCYGLGESERLLGRALGKRRHEAVIASKFGVRVGRDGRSYYDNSPAWLDTALDASLARLGTDHIDLYQLHYWDGSTPLGEVFDRLERKKALGKIRSYGVTNVDLSRHGMPAYAKGLAAFSFEYSLANREHEAAIGAMKALRNLTFLSWGSLGQGILTGKYDRSSLPGEGDRRTRPAYRNFHGPTLDRNLEIVEELRKLAAPSGGRRPSQIAMRWILDWLPGSVVLAGVKGPAQLAENLGAADWYLAARQIELLEQMSRPQQLVA